jgi:hypothetical protein
MLDSQPSYFGDLIKTLSDWSLIFTLTLSSLAKKNLEAFRV